MCEALDLAKKQIEEETIACAIIVNNKIVASATGRGIKPLLELCQENTNITKGAILADKIIGRAASFVAISFGFSFVYGETMSQGAEELLNSHSIASSYKHLAREIRNRANTDICPMDKAVQNTNEVSTAISKIQAAISRL